MTCYAEDDQTFQNTVNYYLQQRLANNSIDDLELVGLTRLGRGQCEDIFSDCMGEGDITEIKTQMVKSDDGMDWEMFKLIAEKRANDAIDAEIPKQILILRSDRDV
jgi:hypothetical protein